MKVTVSDKIPSSDLLVILVPEKNMAKAYEKGVTPTLIKEMEALAKTTEFHKNRGCAVPLSTTIKGAKRVFALGMGEIKQPKNYRDAVAAAVKKANKLKVKHLAIVLPKEVDVPRAVCGAFGADYAFKIGDQKDIHHLPQLTLVAKSQADVKQEVIFGESVGFTKDLVNYPANYIYPASLAAEVKKMAKSIKGLKVTVLGEKQMEKLGMGALLNVGKGSERESQLIVMEYKGGKAKDAPLALIGKGVTFDSGGYNLKPTRYIEDMKSDMAGAATVIGLMRYFAMTKVKKNLVGVVGAVENMVSHNAYRPGDVVTAMNGKTIEIGNTDAEGRLVLADAIHYTEQKYKPAQIVDFATLTGACMVALGYTISGLIGTDQKLVDDLLKASQLVDEDLWQLPLNDYFIENTKGSISDLNNISDGVMAGSSMAAAFLSNFVTTKSWAHFDIAGTAFNGKNQPGGAKRATGAVMRTIRQWIENQ